MYKYYPDTTIPGIFRNRAPYYRNDAFLRHRVSDLWIDICWEEAYIKTNAISSHLINCGVNPGDRIAIYAENRPEWVLADLGILSAGAASVAIHSAGTAREAAFIINDAEAKICFCSGRGEVYNLLSAKSGLSPLEHVIVFDHGDYGNEMIMTLDRVIQEGLANDRSEDIENRVRSIDPGDTMTVLYMADLTGYPCGTRLSARDILGDLHDFEMPQPRSAREVILSALPLSDALERCRDCYGTMHRGGTIAFFPGADRLHDNPRGNRFSSTETASLDSGKICTGTGVRPARKLPHTPVPAPATPPFHRR